MRGRVLLSVGKGSVGKGSDPFFPGEYADTFALRGYDSVQLAAARTLSDSAPGPVQFACFDRRLQNAA